MINTLSKRKKMTIPGSGNENNICYRNFKNETDCNNTLVKSNDSKDNIPYHVCEWHDVYGCINESFCTTCH